jgi:hypothetical protein
MGLADEIARKLDLGNEKVMNTSVTIARDVPGEFSINQVGAIYSTLVEGWSYLSDPSFEESYKSAGLALQDDVRAGTVGAGDCEDFAILIASLIESLGGSTRILFVQYDETVGTIPEHAYAELFLGQKDDPQLENLTKWIQDEYGVSSTPGLSYDGEDAWPNLEYNSSYIGGPFFGGEKVSRNTAWTTGNKTTPKIIPLIDPMDSLDPWQATNDDIGSNITLSLIPSRKSVVSPLCVVFFRHHYCHHNLFDCPDMIRPAAIARGSGLPLSLIIIHLDSQCLDRPH